jgi:lysophospholipase L1-like esterase
MIWRFHQDVIQLHPDTVVILAGTNDIAFNKAVDVYTERNLQTMVEMARHHGIRVVLCTVPPLNMGDIAQQTYLDGRVRILNDWLLRYSVQQHLSLIDDFAALSDVTGRMAPSLTVDGVHPNAAGYAIMRQLAQQAIDSPPKN